MGPKQSLEGVIFGLKSPCLRGLLQHVLGLQCHPSDCSFRSEWFVWINGTQGTHQAARIGDGGHVRCSISMVSKRFLEIVFISLKSPCLRGVERHVLGLHPHTMGCNFRLEWFLWINCIFGTCQTSSFGGGAHAKCLMGPKR